MPDSLQEKIHNFLEDSRLLSPKRHELLLALRAEFQNAKFGFSEGFKYGGITYNLNGELVAGIFSYKGHVSIEFSNGAEFTDPHNVLEGGGKHRRHIKITTPEDIGNKALAEYIQQLGK
ncbi:DUF1801 domain-containing protein [Aliiglaciecola sp. M165]|uniref:DUF1801 domain-containing protein n=1 Tax=Aliiglaciecola sp. M165 TaxID=2593649 RepID=UPI0011811FCF|nr:DUF1801 domain-containing protein [Aliiglaciecola sp. M165]TRY32527.1 DUF1801 domain-containing protein [Aliiglaciecola sp. M165]